MPRLNCRRTIIAAFGVCVVLLGLVSLFRNSDVLDHKSQPQLPEADLPEERGCESDMPEGYGPRIELPFVDDVASFLSFPEFTRGASAAVIAPEYRLRAQNLQATVSEDLMEYSLGQRNLKAYDLQECAGLCDSMPGCKAFNLYFQRSPSVAPSDDDLCPNPPSMTNIFCSLYSTGLKARDMTREGETRGQFEIVITGSNVFNKEDSAPSKTEWLPKVTLLPTPVPEGMVPDL